MHSLTSLLALASTASAIQGFNYGSTFTTGAAKQQSDFENEFTTAQNLVGTSGWTSARLYTMVQGGTASDPISAIPAAIKTKTTLLLGLWASGGDTSFSNEILALKAAIKQYGDDFAKLVDGISVGSEDLYRNSPQGIAAGSNVGVGPDVIARYIKETKEAIAGTGLAKAPIGHVDTWTAWYNGTNQPVIDACDWIGMDAYPYFQDSMPNDISQSKSLFQDALGKTQQAGGGKPVWITETGQPVSGKTVGQSIASTSNAETYWKDVVCPLIDSKTNLWYYTLQDAAPDTPSPSFGIVGNKLQTTPLFDLGCNNTKSESSSSASASASATASGSSGSGSGSGSSASATASGSSSTAISGGSPGGVGSGQISSQGSATVTPTALSPGATGTGSGSGSSGSGSGSNGTFTSLPPSSSTSVPASSGTGLQSGAFAAAFAAIMGAIYAL
ncbi:glycoside hydrolase family 17 protein [Annulohypoxylon maeteangense]|uniref:glycoside hydrolase family 17 protein n=1 Tax=Annulohypoxylon maeteangense TaxID=1927788 RepID=UPI002008620B|nr:glycoside hydrolase family 17 protein [Annulohypoxylon maeteangense]KAI0888943.1 glycoside hydrolase family 17 protein [Annulohypoxylon maeteangense]